MTKKTAKKKATKKKAAKKSTTTKATKKSPTKKKASPAQQQNQRNAARAFAIAKDKGVTLKEAWALLRKGVSTTTKAAKKVAKTVGGAAKKAAKKATAKKATAKKATAKKASAKKTAKKATTSPRSSSSLIPDIPGF